MMRSRLVRTVAVAILSLLMAGCVPHVPTDPNGTLERVSGGVLRVGVSPYPPWTVVESGQEPRGVEPDLVRDFAERIDAEVAWEVSGESELTQLLQDGRLDLVIGGLESATPWSNQVGLTRPYLTTVDVDGKRTDHVMAIQNGENDFLFTLEDHLAMAEIQVPDSVRVDR